jgi:hypothetical protein
MCCSIKVSSFWYRRWPHAYRMGEPLSRLSGIMHNTVLTQLDTTRCIHCCRPACRLRRRGDKRQRPQRIPASPWSKGTSSRVSTQGPANQDTVDVDWPDNLRLLIDASQGVHLCYSPTYRRHQNSSNHCLGNSHLHYCHYDV